MGINRIARFSFRAQVMFLGAVLVFSEPSLQAMSDREAETRDKKNG